MMRIILFLATNLAIVLVASITLSLLGVGSYMTGQGLDYNNLLIFSFIFGMAGSVVSLLLSKFMAKRSMGVQLIEQPQNADQQWLYSTVKELANKANIALVAVSTGLLNKMNREEVKAVLGHEIGHVANGDMITLTLIQGVVNAFVMFFARIIGSFIDRVVLKNENGYGIGFFIATFVAEIILGILASTIVYWFSRRREYRADIAGAELVNPAAMVSALARLKAEYEQPSDMPTEMVAFGISGELKNSLGGLFMSHPPLDMRIAALRQRYNA